MRKYIVSAFFILVALYAIQIAPNLPGQLIQLFVDTAYQVARAITKIDLPGMTHHAPTSTTPSG
jgi:hypothetical protein